MTILWTRTWPSIILANSTTNIIGRWSPRSKSEYCSCRIFQNTIFISYRDDLVFEGDEDTDIEGLDRNLARNFTAARRKIPRIQCPFDEEVVEHLLNAIDAATRENYTPQGYGYHPGEGEYEPWKARQYITVNRRDVGLTLPEEIWVPRAALWIRSIEFLTSLLVQQE